MMRNLASSLALLIATSCNATTVPPSAAGSIASAKPVQRPVAKPPGTPPKTIVKPGPGASPTVPGQEVGAYAQTWANQIAANNCQLAHRNGDTYGENLYWASGGAKTPAQVVGLWAAEKTSYDHASNSCAQGQVCGHYTQVIWSSTQRIGCGKATCGGGEVWVCNYDPPGNFTGQSPY